MHVIGRPVFECTSQRDGPHQFMVDRIAADLELVCPFDGSPARRVFRGDSDRLEEDVVVFALTVSDIRDMDGGNRLSVEQCLKIGSEIETPWETIEALVELARAR